MKRRTLDPFENRAVMGGIIALWIVAALCSLALTAGLAYLVWKVATGL